MNKNRHRLIFSKRLGVLIAVAEIVTSKGKSASGESRGARSGSGLTSRGGLGWSSGVGAITSMPALSLVLSLADPGVVWSQSLPTGGQVVAGQATISQSGNAMTITQSTSKGVIDWNTYNIGSPPAARLATRATSCSSGSVQYGDWHFFSRKLQCKCCGR